MAPLLSSRFDLNLALILIQSARLRVAKQLRTKSSMRSTRYGTIEGPLPVNTGTASRTRSLPAAAGHAASVLKNPAIYGSLLGIGLLVVLNQFLHSELASPKSGLEEQERPAPNRALALAAPDNAV